MTLKLIKNTNIKEFPICENPPMFCFGGRNIAIEIEKIKDLNPLYWYGNDNDRPVPVLMFTLSDGTKISADMESAEEAERAIKEFKKQCKIKAILKAP